MFVCSDRGRAPAPSQTHSSALLDQLLARPGKSLVSQVALGLSEMPAATASYRNLGKEHSQSHVTRVPNHSKQLRGPFSSMPAARLGQPNQSRASSRVTGVTELPITQVLLTHYSAPFSGSKNSTSLGPCSPSSPRLCCTCCAPNTRRGYCVTRLYRPGDSPLAPFESTKSNMTCGRRAGFITRLVK